LLRKLTGGKLAVVADQVLVSGMNFALVVFAARRLSSADFAGFAYLLLGVMLLLALQQGFISTPSLTLASLFTPEENAQYHRVLYALHVAFIALAVAGLYVFLIFGYRFGRGVEHSGTESLECLYFATRLHQDFCRRSLLAQRSFTLGLAADGVMFVATCLGALLLYVMDWRSGHAFYLMLAVATSCGSLYRYGRLMRVAGDPAIRWRVLVRHLRTGGWLGVTAGFSALGGTLIHMLAGFRLGPEAIAGLRACGNISRFVNVVVLSVENYLPQLMAKRIQSQSRDEAHRELVVKTTIVLGLLFTAAAGVFAALSGEILAFLYGAEFRRFGAVASVYLAVPLISGLTVPSAIYIRSLERSRWIFTFYVASILPALAAADTLVTRFGAMGAVACMALSQLIYFALVFGQGCLLRTRRT
jgi:O-antigen/teichoic acid export membrane protein